MKAILISDHAKWCALMMNGDKIIEVRTSKTLYKATQKLIDEYGFAEFYVYCSKDDDLGCIKKISKDKYVCGREFDIKDFNYLSSGYNGKGKVAFKFRCYKIEEIYYDCGNDGVSDDGYKWFYTEEIYHCGNFEKASCLHDYELFYYLQPKKAGGSSCGYAIHISDLEIFDRPKELSEFNIYCDKHELCKCDNCKRLKQAFIEFGFAGEYCDSRLTKAPQNFCYVEAE